MFTIIGGDGREYGPATVEQIRAWMAAGRANLDTKAKAVGSEEWRRLGDYAEFMGGAVPPPIPAGAAVAAPGGARVVNEAELADRGLRFLSWLLDNVIAFIAVLPGMMVAGFSLIRDLITHPGEVSPELGGRAAIAGLLIGFGALVIFVIQLWMLTTRGQTIAKRILGLRIVMLADRSNPGFVRAVLLRWFVPGIAQFVLNFLPPLGLVFFVVDSCFIFRADRRCIHDLIADTIVVKA